MRMMLGFCCASAVAVTSAVLNIATSSRSQNRRANICMPRPPVASVCAASVGSTWAGLSQLQLPDGFPSASWFIDILCQRRLLAEVRDGRTQRSFGDLDQSLIGRVHLQDQEDGPGHRQRGDEQAEDHRRVERSEETEADEDGGEPEHEDDQERQGDRRRGLLEHQPARLADFHADAKGLALQRSLHVVLRRELLDGGVEPLPGAGCRRRARGAGAVTRPQLVEHPRRNRTELCSRLPAFGSVQGEEAVENGDVRGHLRQFRTLRIVRALGRGNQQAEYEGGHGTDQPHPQLYGVLGVITQVMIRQELAEEDAEQRAAEHAPEHDQGNTHPNTTKAMMIELMACPLASAPLPW